MRLRAGDPAPYLVHAARQGRLSAADDLLQAKRRLLADWWQAAAHDPARTVMLAYRRDDVADLNQAAHALMLRRGRLGAEAVTLKEREFRVGDRVLCRRNDARLRVRNGTRGTILDLHPSALTLRTDAGSLRSLPYDYAAEQLDHAYALTGHAAQGATFERAYALLHDQGALREWGYVACSRARAETRLYLAERAIEREPYVGDPSSSPSGRAARALERSSAEPLALEQTRTGRDLSARAYARLHERLESQRKQAAERLGAVVQELRRLRRPAGRTHRSQLQAEIAFRRAALGLADERVATLQPARARQLPASARDVHEHGRARTRQLQHERRPPGLQLEH
jgi:hypothetical protein